MPKKTFFITVVLTLLLVPLQAADDLLNLSSRSLFLKQGYPDDLVPTRGETEEEDGITVIYNEGISFLLWENRVKEIRADKRYRGSIFGLYMGMTPKQVCTALGISPQKELPGEMIFHKTDGSFPVQIHLFFYSDKLVNITVSS